MIELRFSGDDMLYANKRFKLCQRHLSAFLEFGKGKPRFSVPESYIDRIAETPKGECPICYLNLPQQVLQEMPTSETIQ